MIKKQQLIAFSAFLAVLLLSSNRHPIYLSIAQVEFNPHGQSLEISMKIFKDDLSLALGKPLGDTLYLGEAGEKSYTDSLLNLYVQKHVEIIHNEAPLQLAYLGKEIEHDVAWCYIEAKGINEVRELSITNTMLLAEFDGQTNVVHVNVEGKQKSLLITEKKKSGILKF